MDNKLKIGICTIVMILSLIKIIFYFPYEIVGSLLFLLIFTTAMIYLTRLFKNNKVISIVDIVSMAICLISVGLSIPSIVTARFNDAMEILGFGIFNIVISILIFSKVLISQINLKKK